MSVRSFRIIPKALFAFCLQFKPMCGIIIVIVNGQKVLYCYLLKEANDLDNNNKQSLEEMIAETMKNKEEKNSSDKISLDKPLSEPVKENLNFDYYKESVEETDEEQEPEEEKDEKSSKKTNKAIIVAFSVLGFFLALILGFIGLFYHYVSKINIQDTEAEILDSIVIEDLVAGPDSPEAQINSLESKMRANFNKDGLMQSDDVMNILILGTDSREDNARGRSDSMILVSINKVSKEIVMTSLLRDMYVSVPGKENTKLTHAYSYGGADLAVDTVEQNFKIKIDNYVQINFSSFIKIVDAVGGIDIDVTSEEVEYVNSYLYELNNLDNSASGTGYLTGSGTLHLNGKQALAYSRIRYVGTDFARTERQRIVLEKVIKKAAGLSIGELSDFVDEFLPEITTNLKETTILSMVLKSPSYFKYDILQGRVPVDDSWEYMTIRSMSVLGVDFEANQKYLYETIYHYTEEE